MGVDPTPFTPACGRIRIRPEDFLVEEVGALEPTGSGEHIAAWVVKRGVDHQTMVRRVAKQLGVKPSKVSWAGTKDRMAVTQQWITIHAPDAMLPELDEEDISLQRVMRHERRIRLGQLVANRFCIRIRDIDPLQAPCIHRQLLDIQRRGLSNRFMEQRFGHRGANPCMGSRLLLGDIGGVLDAWLGTDGPAWPSAEEDRRRYYDQGQFDLAAAGWPRKWHAEIHALKMLSQGASPEDVMAALPRPVRRYWTDSVQSSVFNDVLSLREAAGTLHSIGADDISWTHDRFLDSVGAVDSDCPVESATGPLWGRKMRRATGAVDEMEVQAARAYGLTDEIMHGSSAPTGSRRPLIVPIAGVSAGGGFDEHGAMVEVSFILPKGCYATAVIDEIINRDES